MNYRLRIALLAVAVLVGPRAAIAQTPLPAPEAPTQAVSTSLDLYPLGKPFGTNQKWQIGIDESATIGACVQRELHDGQWLGGYCRDIFVLAKTDYNADGSTTQIPVFHVGGYALYNAQQSNGSYGVRAGVNVGSVAQAALQKLAGNLPAIETLVNWQPPPFIAYITQVTTIDFGVAWRPVHDSSVSGSLTYGPMATLNIPISDIMALIRGGL